MTEETVVPSFLFFDIEQELWAIEDFRVAMERQLPIVAKNETDRYYEKAAQQDDEAVKDGMEQWAHLFSEETLPRLFRSQILVTLWAVYEAAIDEIGEHLRVRGGHSLMPNSFRGGKLDRYKLYFQHILKFPLVNDVEAEEYLGLLLKLRNAIAHANGRRDAISEDVWKIFKQWQAKGKGLSADDHLSFTAAFIEEMVAVISKSLNDLIDRAKLV